MTAECDRDVTVRSAMTQEAFTDWDNRARMSEPTRAFLFGNNLQETIFFTRGGIQAKQSKLAEKISREKKIFRTTKEKKISDSGRVTFELKMIFTFSLPNSDNLVRRSRHDPTWVKINVWSWMSLLFARAQNASEDDGENILFSR